MASKYSSNKNSQLWTMTTLWKVGGTMAFNFGMICELVANSRDDVILIFYKIKLEIVQQQAYC